MSRFLIIGAGALGALLAAQWTQAGIPATLIARGRALEVIASEGVRVRRPQGDDVVRVDVTGSIADARPVSGDTVVLAVKSQDAEQVLTEIAWVALSDGSGVVADLPILTLQNGLAAEDLALRRFSNVIGVSVGIAASHLEPGVVVSPSWPTVGVVWLGAYPVSDQEAESRYREAFEHAGFAVTVEPDIAAAKRRKLLGNLRNGLEVFHAGPAEVQDAHDALRAETIRVFDALDLPIAPDGPPFSMDFGQVEGHVPGRLSTWQSFARGTSSEGDYLSGEVVLLARRARLSAPLNAAIARGLGSLAARGGGPGEIALADVLRRSDIDHAVLRRERVPA